MPWSLGLVGVLAAVSFLFGGDRSADEVAESSRGEATFEDLYDEALSNDPLKTSEDVDSLLRSLRARSEQEIASEEAQSLAAEQEAERLRLEELLVQEDSALRAEIAELARLRQQAELTRAAAERAAQSTRAAESTSQNPTNTAPQEQPQEDGVLRLIVLPFADVYVQGTLRARATSRFELPLAPGTYDLRLVNPNRATVDTTFVIDPGQPTGVRATLPPRNQ